MKYKLVISLLIPVVLFGCSTLIQNKGFRAPSSLSEAKVIYFSDWDKKTADENKVTLLSIFGENTPFIDGNFRSAADEVHFISQNFAMQKCGSSSTGVNRMVIVPISKTANSNFICNGVVDSVEFLSFFGNSQLIFIPDHNVTIQINSRYSSPVYYSKVIGLGDLRHRVNKEEYCSATLQKLESLKNKYNGINVNSWIDDPSNWKGVDSIEASSFLDRASSLVNNFCDGEASIPSVFINEGYEGAKVTIDQEGVFMESLKP